MAPTRVDATRIGSLLFCPACGTLLDLPKDDQDEIPCAQCGRLEPASCEWSLSFVRTYCDENLERKSKQGGHVCDGLPSAVLDARSPSRHPRPMRWIRRLCKMGIGEYGGKKKKKLMNTAYENLPTKTYSSPNAFPSSLRSKRALVQNKVDDSEAATDKDPIVSFAQYSIQYNTPDRVPALNLCVIYFRYCTGVKRVLVEEIDQRGESGDKRDEEAPWCISDCVACDSVYTFGC
jgi:hypothetical protein